MEIKFNLSHNMAMVSANKKKKKKPKKKNCRRKGLYGKYVYIKKSARERSELYLIKRSTVHIQIDDLLCVYACVCMLLQPEL